jgi:hypothetical protein
MAPLCYLLLLIPNTPYKRLGSRTYELVLKMLFLIVLFFVWGAIADFGIKGESG